VSWEIRQGDALERLREMPDESVHCCVTSPPYYGLRDYGTASWDGGDPDCEHEAIGRAADKVQWDGSLAGPGNRPRALGAPHRGGGDPHACRCGAVRLDQQIGLEPTVDDFIESLVEVFREVRRVLRPEGTLWLNIGDTYATKADASAAATYRRDRARAMAPRKNTTGNGAKPKDLLMVPALLALALRADGWFLRSEIIWHKPTPMPESVRDRPTKAHEPIFLLAKSPRYFYDAEAIREPLAPKTLTTHGSTRHPNGGGELVKADNWASDVPERRGTGRGANKRSVWTIHSGQYPEAHFATFPPALVEPCILAGTSQQVCRECAAPFERVVERKAVGDIGSRTLGLDEHQVGQVRNAMPGGSKPWDPPRTVGWEPSCDHEQGGGSAVVLDPFAGASTTGLVATRLDRSYIGLELNPEYVELGRRRILDDAPLLNADTEIAA
jgi:DNA modification methylase